MSKIVESVLRTLYPSTDVQTVFSMYEKKMEKSLLKLFVKFNITASVKTDPKSLPFQHEVIIRLPYESYIPGMLQYNRCYKEIFKKLLNDDVCKLRFFIHIESDTFGFGSIIYHFKYFVHK